MLAASDQDPAWAAAGAPAPGLSMKLLGLPHGLAAEFPEDQAEPCHLLAWPQKSPGVNFTVVPGLPRFNEREH